MLLVSIRSILKHKGRSAFLMLCIVIGVAFIAGTFVLTDTIKHVYTALFNDAYRGVAVEVRSRSKIDTGRAPMSEDMLAAVKRVEGVNESSADIFTFGGRIFDAKNKPIGNPYAPSFVASYPTAPQLSAFVLATGRPPKAANEVVIDNQAFDAAKVNSGRPYVYRQ